MTKKLFAATLTISIAIGHSANAVITNVQDFWGSCTFGSETPQFQECMAIINGAALFAMMQDSGIHLCTEGRVPLTELGRRIGQLGLQGALDPYALNEPHSLAIAALKGAYPCK